MSNKPGVNDVGLDDKGDANRGAGGAPPPGSGRQDPAQPPRQGSRPNSDAEMNDRENPPSDEDPVARMTRMNQQRREEDKAEEERKAREEGKEEAKDEAKEAQPLAADLHAQQPDGAVQGAAAGAQEKKDAKQKAGRTSMVHTDRLVAKQRSNLLTMGDRHQQELDHLRPGEVGCLTNFLRKKANLIDKKKEVCGLQGERDLPQHDELVRKLEDDGIFIDNSTRFKNEDINVQKLEERLLRAMQEEYFKKNGEIKIDSDLLADERTRPADLAFEQSDAFQTSERNAIVSDRMNSFKKRYYRIDIIVGKVTFRRYAGFFLAEEQKMIDLRHLNKIYDRRVSLALIPFYNERIQYIRAEKDNKVGKDAQFLTNVLNNLEEDLAEEKKQIQKMAKQIFGLWQDIRKLQGEQRYSATFADLKVHQGNDRKDVLFKLESRGQPGKPDEAIVEGNSNRARNSRVFCKLVIDGEEVARTKKMPINWPAYDVDLLDLFQIHVFTLPAKIQLEVVINEGRGLFNEDLVIDRFDLIIPGGHVKSLTSASRSIKEYEFSRKQLYIEEEARKGNDLTRTREEAATSAQEAADKKMDKKLKDMEITGTVFVKAEWFGYGEQMPPARSETLFQMNTTGKNRNTISKTDYKDLLKEQKPIDVNDPRNEEILKNIRKMKNDYLQKLLDRDSKFQLHDIQSFRHKLMWSRINDPAKASIPIPALNSELINRDKCSYYVDWLEDVQRQETFKAYLAQKQEVQDDVMNRADKLIIDNKSLQQHFDRATLQRRQDIFEKINKRRKLAKHGTQTGRQLHYYSVVKEFRIEDGKSPLEILKQYLKVGRKLKPVVKQQRALHHSERLDKDLKLLVHVIRANDVPIRKEYYEKFVQYAAATTKGTRGRARDDDDGYRMNYSRLFSMKQVETFVEVRIVNTETGEEHVMNTTTAEGQYPEWNEVLEHEIQPKNKIEFTKEELEDSPYMIYFTLFDQKTHYDTVTKMRRQTYYENKYLGQIQVPLTTVLSSSKFDGQIRIDRPLVLQGYKVIKDDITFMETASYQEQDKRNEEQVPTYLNISIGLEPLIQLPVKNEKDYYRGKEADNFLQKGTNWIKSIQNKFKQNPRVIKAFLEDIDGESVFIPKFLTPLRPPEQIYKGPNDEKAIEKAARYISLIPYIEDTALFKDMPDLTCTSQEFLDLGQGDSEEHAMLLCNFFNYIDRPDPNSQNAPASQAKDALKDAGGAAGKAGKMGNQLDKDSSAFDKIESYIVYGEAIPIGECWFVARKHTHKPFVELWNPMTGECYNFQREMDKSASAVAKGGAPSTNQRTNDPRCPLKKIWCIVGQDNIWANVQPEDSPSFLNFNLNDTKSWAKFLTVEQTKHHFGESVQSAQIQGTKLEYAPPLDSRSGIRELERQLDKFLTGKFEDERIAQVKKTTNWNLSFGEQFKKVLEAGSGLPDIYAQNRRNKPIDQDAGMNRTIQDANFKKALVDFEEHMLLARKGGTNSKLRPENQAKDEDIRASAVQEYLSDLAAENGKTCWAIPLNATLVSLQQIWEKLKGTKVHEIDNQDVEFSLSVWIKPYPCNVFSVWIYIAAFMDEEE